MIATAATSALTVCAAAGASDWLQPNANASGTRAVASTISSRSVAGLRVRWRFPLTHGSTFGSFA